MAFPLLLIPLAICNIIAFLMPDLSLSGQIPLFSIPLMSKDLWTVTLNDVLVALGIMLLLLEVTRAARPAAKYFVDHLLSLLVFGAAAAEFVMLPKFGNSTFFLITLIAMVDFFAGISLRARRPRRVVATAPAPVPEPVHVEPAPRYEPSPAPTPAAISVAEAVLLESSDPKIEAKTQPKIEPEVEPKPEAVVDPVVEPKPVAPEVVAHTSPQINSPGLQPGDGSHPSSDVPPVTR
ncbi:hypothetical protein [Tardiphaga sp.]|uniref:hypothetical protein n=1 Tax=Tardiphaga sp. TaxID=1926292 RepID=UPI0025FA0A6B|nr:hypothetical protein [Tardiphaga sp.]